jgi:hypothetical protein
MFRADWKTQPAGLEPGSAPVAAVNESAAPTDKTGCSDATKEGLAKRTSPGAGAERARTLLTANPFEQKAVIISTVKRATFNRFTELNLPRAMSVIANDRFASFDRL